MTGRKPLNPKVLLPLGAGVLVVSSAIAIGMAVSYRPESPVTETTTVTTTSAPTTSPPVTTTSAATTSVPTTSAPTTSASTTPTMPTPIAVPVPQR